MTIANEIPKVSAVAPWFGSNRMLAPRVGAMLKGCQWIGIPFAGGMCEVAHVDARTINVNDLHRHVVNLASVMAHPTLGPKLYRRVRRVPFHPTAMNDAQQRCLLRGRIGGDADGLFAAGFEDPRFAESADLDWAVDYFTVAWMIRHGTAGTPGEFTGGPSTRWNAAGGDSAAHFNGAVRSIPAWRRLLRRCNFTTLDAFAFLDKCKDAVGHGVYCDPPFPGPGDGYTHPMGEVGHRRLAAALARFAQARVVIRYYRHPLIEELYPAELWDWTDLAGRKQTNDAAPEVLIMNRDGPPPRAPGPTKTLICGRETRGTCE